MKTRFVRSMALGGLLLLPALTTAQDPAEAKPPQYSAEELDNLVAPVALYADKLLAQVLIAATFPEQVAIAASYVRANGDQGIDAQDWDASVRAVAHYAPVLNMLAKDDDWATALGQAYATQPNDLLDAVQRMRRLAQEKGNLETTPEQKVVVERNYISIEPANPEVIYVPTYDPYYVYYYPIYPYYRHHFHWGIGFPIGPWFGFGFDWFAGRVYYAGWHGYHWGPRWATVVGYYPAPAYRYIRTNPYVYVRRVNYARLDRDFRHVRRDVNFVRHSNNNWKGPARVSDDGRKYAGKGDRDRSKGDWDRSKGDWDRTSGGRPGTFDNGRRDGDRNGGGNRYAESGTRPDLGNDKPGGTRDGSRSRENGPAVFRGGARPDAPDYRSNVRPAEGKARSSNGPTVFRGSQKPTTESTVRPAEAKSRTNGPIVYRGSGSGRDVPTYKPAPTGKGGITYMTPRTGTPTTAGSAGGQAVRGAQMRTAPSTPRTASFAGVSRPSNGGGNVRVSGGGARSSGGARGTSAKSSGGSISGGAVKTAGFGRSRQ